jgi:D-alanyl-D-alanine carboxypeptidase/D-alanyl-D-alanine-endopeptidase (penicillin-binding protein 4)
MSSVQAFGLLAGIKIMRGGIVGAVFCVTLFGIAPVLAQGAAPPKTFSETVKQVMARPVYRHARIGLEVWSLDTGKAVFAVDGDKLFTPGSTTKLFTEGAALTLLGPDYRFHTPLYRTGKLDGKGTLKGDLILVASGDPNISDRIQPDGSLAFVDEDHSYGGVDSRLIPGDPAVVLRQFAKAVADAGIKRVTGRVLIDISLFAEGTRELGTGEVISPILVNDNAIDITYKPGAKIGDPAAWTIAPTVPYIHFVNKIVTVEGTKTKVDDVTTDHKDGTQTVVLTGTVGVGSGPVVYGYALSSPSRFAATLLTLALKDAGVKISGKPGTITAEATETTLGAGTMRKFYTDEMRIAEHVSPPLSEDVKITLKMSQNLHASTMPYLLGAVLGKASEKADHKGFTLEHDWLAGIGLDMSGGSQADGAGGAVAAFYTPDFVVHYLDYMSKQPTASMFHDSLPVLGKDGTLVDIQKDSPGAGHVFAKTGTFSDHDLLNDGHTILTGKGLAGYTTTPDGRRLAFAVYINNVELPDDSSVSQMAGQALGEMASALYALPVE